MIYCLSSVASAPTNVIAEQINLTSISVTWSPSDNANGYIITYITGDISNIVNITSGSTDETILIDLMKEAEYIISIVATSQHFYSDSVMANTVQLGKDRTSLFSDVLHLSLSLSVLFLSVSLPDEPVVEMEDIMTTEDSITITWTTSPTVTGAVVSWEVSDGSTTRAVRQTDSGTSGLITGTNNYTIEGLMSNTEYDITVTVINAAGNRTYGFIHSTDEGNFNVECPEIFMIT